MVTTRNGNSAGVSRAIGVKVGRRSGGYACGCPDLNRRSATGFGSDQNVHGTVIIPIRSPDGDATSKCRKWGMRKTKRPIGFIRLECVATGFLADQDFRLAVIIQICTSDPGTVEAVGN